MREGGVEEYKEEEEAWTDHNLGQIGMLRCISQFYILATPR